MIYTLTLNPALDYIISIPKLVPGDVNRSQGELIFPGGKGINVSHVLHNMGCSTTILGFTAGLMGDLLLKLLHELGIPEDMLAASGGNTRLNIALRATDESREETEITGVGPLVTPEDLAGLYKQLGNLQDGDTLVMSGSIPASVPDSVYADIMDFLADKKIRIAVDSTRDRLLNVLPRHPFLIKPNHHELGEIFGVTLRTREEVIPYAIRLRDMGALNVLVSLAGEGGVLAASDGNIYLCEAPKGVVKNSVGAGDSTVAGFLYGYEKTGSCQEAFLYGLSCGSASAFSDGFAEPELVEKLHDSIACVKYDN